MLIQILVNSEMLFSQVAKRLTYNLHLLDVIDKNFDIC